MNLEIGKYIDQMQGINPDKDITESYKTDPYGLLEAIFYAKLSHPETGRGGYNSLVDTYGDCPSLEEIKIKLLELNPDKSASEIARELDTEAFWVLMSFVVYFDEPDWWNDYKQIFENHQSYSQTKGAIRAIDAVLAEVMKISGGDS